MLDESLFRSQAIREFRDRSTGDPMVKLPVTWSLVGLFLLVALVGGVVFLLTGDYARKERATGLLRFSEGEAAVQTPMSGIVEQLFVEEGAAVQEGAPLFVIRSVDLSPEGAEFPVEYVASIESELALLADRQVAEQNTLLSRGDELEAQRSGLRLQLDALERQRELAEEQVVLLERRYTAGAELLERGVLSATALEDRRLVLLDQNDRVAALDAQHAQLQIQLASVSSELEQLPLEVVRSEIATAQLRTQLERDLLEVQARSGVQVAATTSGRVAALQSHRGESVLAGERVLTLVADGSRLEGVLYLPSRVMAHVRPGITVRIFYDAYPHRRYGVATATVESVSATVYVPEEIPTGLGIEEAAYLTVIKLDSQEIDAFNQHFPLRSGMTFSAEIVLERQSLIDWLFEPLQIRG